MGHSSRNACHLRRVLLALCALAIFSVGLSQWTLVLHFQPDPSISSQHDLPPQRISFSTTTTQQDKHGANSNPFAEQSSNRKNERKISIVDNVLLQGQFNHVTSLEWLLAWYEVWSQYFSNILLVGPFPKTTHVQLRQRGISSRPAKLDPEVGAVAPYENLRNTLLEYQNHTFLQGIITIHDDALINVSQLLHYNHHHKNQHQQSRTFSLDTILSTFHSKAQRDKQDYRIHLSPNGINITFSRKNQHFHSIAALKKSLSKWERWDQCLESQVRMVLQNAVQWKALGYLDKGDSLYFPGYSQSDVVYIPTNYAHEFDLAARGHIKSGVWLECAVPTIVSMMQTRRPELKAQRVGLCTSWQYNVVRGQPQMIDQCVQRRLRTYNNTNNKAQEFHAVYHPFKLSQHGVQVWRDMVDRVQISYSVG